jgi:LmbE family N-acetylglucosaminyl deacetylase
VGAFRARFTVDPRASGTLAWMSSPAVILSPHLDDAVLSCWHLLDGAGDVRVITVFAGIPPAGSDPGWWDRANGHADSAQAVRARIDEDRAALALAGRCGVNLDFLDAQYRPAPGDPRLLATVLRERIPGGALVYAPVAIGRKVHPDHGALRTAALDLRASGYRTALYADLPHANRSAAAGWPEKAPRVDGLVAIQRRLDPRSFARKVAAVRRYRSQVASIERAFKRRIDDPALLGCEVVWLPQPAGAGQKAVAGVPSSSSRAAARKLAARS